MATYYIPVSEIGLVEFLSSGYIGISNSNVEYDDIHTKIWPSTAVIKEMESGCWDLLCEIEVDTRAFALKAKANGKSLKIFQLKRSTSIGDIKRIIFPSQEAIEDFTAKYHYMDDLNIIDFEIFCEPSIKNLNSQYSYIPNGLTINSIPLSYSQESIDDKLCLLIRAKKMFSYVVSFRSNFPLDTRFTLEDFHFYSNGTNLFKGIANLLGCKSPTKSFELILNHYIELCDAELIHARTDQIEILEKISERIEKSVEDASEVCKAKGFIERIINIFMGMESHPDLSEENYDKTFQFGFYVSLILKNLTDLQELKNKFLFSVQVEAIASYLFLIRTKFSQIPASTFKLFGSKKKDWSAAFIKSYKAGNSCVFIKSTPQINSLDLNCSLTVNDNVLISFVRSMSLAENKLLSTLQLFNIVPTRDPETSFLSIFKYVSDQPIKVLFEIIYQTENQHFNQINIHYRSNIQHDILAKSKSRLHFLKMTSRLKVVIGVDEKGFLIFSRFQMADTIDKEVIWHHIEQITETAAFAQRLNVVVN